MANYSTVTMLFNTTTVPLMRSRPDYCQLPRGMTNNLAFACLIVFIPVTVLGNLLVIFVILSSQSLKKQTTFLFLASLAVADTLVGMISMPFHARIQWRGGFLCLGATPCWIYILEEIFLSVTSVIHLFVIGIDRYVSLRYVYQYNTLVTRRRIIVAISSIWGLSAAITSLVIFDWKEPFKVTIITKPSYLCAANNIPFFTALYIGCFIVPLFCMVYTYSYVYRTASYHIKEIAKMEILTEHENKKSRDKKRKKRQFRTLRSIVIVFVVYSVCWYPTIFYILSIFHAREFWRKHQRTAWWKIMHFALINFLPPLNSTTNPFIYVLCNKQFRKVCKQLYYKLTNQEQRTISYVTTVVTDMNLNLHSYNKVSQKDKHKLSVLNSPEDISTSEMM